LSNFCPFFVQFFLSIFPFCGPIFLFNFWSDFFGLIFLSNFLSNVRIQVFGPILGPTHGIQSLGLLFGSNFLAYLPSPKGRKHK
jgi:hypothetical protein